MGLFQKKHPNQAADAAGRLAVNVETVRAVLGHYASGTRLTFGAPTRCPQCGDYGFVQGVDRSEGVSYNHCFGCRADWVITIEALRIALAEPRPPTPAATGSVPSSTREASPWFAQSVAALAAARDKPAAGAPGREPVAPIPATRTPVAPILASRRTDPAATETTEARPTTPDIGRNPTPETTRHLRPEPQPTDHPNRPAAARPSSEVGVAGGAREPAAADRFASGSPTDHTEPEPVAFTPEPVRPAAGPRPAPRSDAPVLDAAMLARLSRPGRVVEPSNSSAPAADGRVLRVIVAEDNPFDLAVLEELVEISQPRSIELLTAETREEAERLAATTDHDLILLDLDLPDSTGITTLLEWQHRAVSDAPVIILSGTNDADLVREARALGAVHFIQKEQLSELADAGVVGANRLARLLRTTVRRSSSQPRSS